jgi:hypothetical protein
VVGALYSNDKKSVNKAGAVKRKCVEFIKDPKFKFLFGNATNPIPPYNNDFALCRLNKPIFDVEPIAINENPKLPPLKTSNSPTKLTVIGLGLLKFNGNSTLRLQQVQVPIVSNRKCKSAYGKKNIFTPGNICAGSGGKDACQGDSGAPLIYKKNEKDFHVGTYIVDDDVCMPYYLMRFYYILFFNSFVNKLHSQYSSNVYIIVQSLIIHVSLYISLLHAVRDVSVTIKYSRYCIIWDWLWI